MMTLRRSVLVCVVVALLLPVLGHAASKQEIDARVGEALEVLYKQSPAAKKLSAEAHGILVFPRVIKGGMGVGAEYGEGALLVGGRNANYYSIASASIGLQLGVQRKSVVVFFMNNDVLRHFERSEGWKAGVDGSVAIATLGAGGEIDTAAVEKPIIGFVFSNQGLMYNLTIEGSKITRLVR